MLPHNVTVSCLFWFALSLNQVAVCNLASIALNMYVTPDKTFDFTKLASVTKVIVKNLNKIIDINYYPVPEVCLLFSVASLSHVQPGLVCFALTDGSSVPLYRLKGRTCATGPLE